MVVESLHAQGPPPVTTSAPPGSDPTLARVVAVGLGAGLLSGSFGVGGGVLMVPAMVLLLGIDQRRASGTSLAAIVPIAAVGVVGFAIQDQLDLPAAALLGIGAITGAPLGARLIHTIPVPRLRAGFAALLLLTAARLLFALPESVVDESIGIVDGASVVAVGFASGLLAGLFGVGGGILMVPAQMVILGIDPATAKGTSLLVVIPAAASGTVQNLRRANSDLRVAAILGASGALTAFGGAFLATRMSTGVASGLFALLLVASALRMIDLSRWGATRRRARSRGQDRPST